jgi:hypothetical protein
MNNRSQRYKKIIEENKKFEEESPYNFCDRWCERCIHETQMRCKLYLDDLERRATCIAHGKDEDDLEITKEVMRAQYADIEKGLEEAAEKFGIDLDFPDGKGLDEEDRIELEDLPPELQEHIKFVESHPLPLTVEQYHQRCHTFLKDNFYERKKIAPEIKYNFETVSWYHTLLPAKLQRALAGFHEPVCEEEFALYDAVAQFLICKKSIQESVKALRQLQPHYPKLKNTFIELLALLHNIFDRIEAIEESI